MKVALFIPCYVDQFYPQVGIATLQLLQKLGCDVVYPQGQTCCGQPLANTGMEEEAKPIYHHFVETFQDYAYVVTPSGSCTHHVRHHYDVIEQNEAVTRVRARTYDLVEFLVDVLQVKSLEARFPHKVALHQSCHGLRGLRLASGSERVDAPYSKVMDLLNLVDGLEVVPLQRRDECCGFGGTFAINETAISAKMGRDRVRDFDSSGAEVVTAGDMSCLMHLEGIIRRQKRTLQVKHLAEILNAE
jgi:L-lactate dehydrogenase complex protein LldE